MTGLPRAIHVPTPPSTTGRASTPCATRTLAATAARAPDSQRVTTGRSVATSAASSRDEPVGDVARAGDVAVVALVLLPHVDHVGSLVEELLEVVDTDRLELLGPAAENEARNVQEADRAQAADRALRFGLIGGEDADGPLGIEQKAGLRREAGARDGDADRAVPVPVEERGDRAHVEQLGTVRRYRFLRRLGGCADEGASVEADDAFDVRRLGSRDRCRLGDERVELRDSEDGVEASLEPDRRRRLRAHGLAAERSGDVARIDLDAVGQLEQALQRVEDGLGSLSCPDGEVGAPGVADEEGIAGEQQPRLVGPRVVDHREAAVLRPVAGRVEAAERDVADLDLVAVLDRVGSIFDLGGRVDRDREIVLERETAVA